MKTNCATFYFKSLCIKLVVLHMNLYQEIAVSCNKFSGPCSKPSSKPNL